MSTDGHTAPHGFGADIQAPELSCRALPAEPARVPSLRRALMAWATSVGLSTEQAEMVGFAG
ncbi:hypothetical protein OOZ19_03320 [Saccharopolyspora sp. NFXS83]|uniref:hypothetical protein n=1 Tax=Saccharopolyspora sp. NFXS83 TaxID=2993560 RepID=UPI00224AF166|nr:hypothetical protein [Saccharopolyspora sp. NFXS83]MCX2729258.1 hypothetical protein [Saccharopolyspora sp. NFXS83]